MYEKLRNFIATSIYMGSVGYNGYDEAAKKCEKFMLEELRKARIEENESILEMAKAHMDHRAILVLIERIKELENEK